MTKKNKLISIICVAIIGALAVFGGVFGIIFASLKRTEYNSEYQAVYGEWFVLPENDSVKVFYDDGKRAEVDANRVFIDDDGDYRLVLKSRGKRTVSTLKVNVNKKPAVYIQHALARIKITVKCRYVISAVGNVKNNASLFNDCST